MYLSDTEKQQRYVSLREQMKKAHMDALVVVGDPGIGGTAGPGNFRYLSDFFIIFHYGLLFFFAEEEPVIMVTSELQRYWALKHSWIDDVRFSSDYTSDAAEVFKEKARGTHGRLGLAGTESLSHSVYQSFQENLPAWQIIDATSILFELRFSKSQEEQQLLKKAADIIDKGFQSVLNRIRPGVKEFEITGFLDGFHRGHGCDQTFNLISSGSFPRGNNKDFPGLPWYPSDREIKKGDVVLMEMTAAYGGYWNQLVRAVSVDAENRDLTSFHGAMLHTIQAGVTSMKPGVLTSDFVASMDTAAKEKGFELTFPMGHFVGLDLVEARVHPQSQQIMKPGTAVIIHPCLSGSSGIRILWGQTYLVSETGTTCMNRAGDELVVVT